MGVGILTTELRKAYPVKALAGSGRVSKIVRYLDIVKKQHVPQKRNSKILALDGVSLRIEPGQVFGLLGPNGAGKSTFAGILTTRIRATSGRAWIDNLDVAKDQVAIKKAIGVVQQHPNLDLALTAREILMFHGAYFCMKPADYKSRSAELLEEFELTDRADHSVRGFSGGMKQRLSIARALMHDPQVLFLDEPSTGLDPQTRLRVWEIIRRYNRNGKTVLLSTHNMHEAEQLCDEIAIIDHGRVIVSGTPKQLKAAMADGHVFKVRFSAVPTDLTARLKRISGVTQVCDNLLDVDIHCQRSEDHLSKIIAASAECAVDVLEVQVSEPTLESLFLHYTGRSLRQWIGPHS
jgi:ABC-2 type transport system ATP-binding protein